MIVIWGHYEYCCYNHMLITNIMNIIYMSFHLYVCKHMGFPGSSVGKESICNAGDPSSIPGLERSPGEGICFLVQYSWASMVAQMVTNPIVVWETWPSLGLGIYSGEGHGNPLQYSCLEIPMDRGAWRATILGAVKSWTLLSD